MTVREVAKNPDGSPILKTTALETLPHKQMEKEYGAGLRERLNRNLRAIGVDSFIDNDRVRIRGISKECEDHFSKRSERIKETAEGDAIEKNKASLKTRDKKNKAHTLPVCEGHWRKELEEKFHLTHQSLPSLRIEKEQQQRDPFAGVTLPPIPQKTRAHEPERSLAQEKKEAVEVVVKNLYRYRDSFSKGQLQTALKRECQARGMRDKDALDAADDFIGRGSTYKIRNQYGREVYTTHDGPRIRNEEREARRRAYEEKTRPVRESVFQEIQKEFRGHKCIALTRDKAGAEALKKEIKMPAASIKTMMNEIEGKRFRKSKWTGEWVELDKGDEARKKFFKQAGAELKYLTGQISLETKKKLTGDYWKPRTEMVHKFLWATGQISKNRMRHLDAELRHEQLKVTNKTVIIVSQGISQHPLFPALIEAVQKRGGKIVYAHEKIRERVTQELKAERELEKLREDLAHEKDQKIKQSHGIKIPLKL